jgi:metal-dependent amidase/aminoacylase/carboxypeptidase family protein
MVNFHTFDSNLNMELKDKIGELSEKHYNEIVNHREWFHQHPETAFKEFKTANYIQKFFEKTWN